MSAKRSALRIVKLIGLQGELEELARAGEADSRAFRRAAGKYEKLQAKCLAELPALAASVLARDHPEGLAEDGAPRQVRFKVEGLLGNIVPDRSQEGWGGLLDSLGPDARARAARRRPLPLLARLQP